MSFGRSPDRGAPKPGSGLAFAHSRQIRAENVTTLRYPSVVGSAGRTVGGMARPLRVTFPGALYHVMARGNAQEDVFCADADFEFFLDLLARTVER
jgi:hypothetical protein